MDRSDGLFHRPKSQSVAAASQPNASMGAPSRRRHSAPVYNRDAVVYLTVLAAIAIVAVVAIFMKMTPHKASLMSGGGSCPHGEERTWRGGHPAEDRPGSCWCGGDEYCMCTPSLAIDIVLYSKIPSKDEYHVWVVRRADTGQLATIGGFVDVGETTEGAVLRETEEETGIVIRPEQAASAMKLIGVYSDPRRDNRRAIASVAYALEYLPSTMRTKDGTGVPKAGDDAKEVVAVPLEEIGAHDWYADHLTILLDFKEQTAKATASASVREGELYEDVARSLCGGGASRAGGARKNKALLKIAGV